MTTSKEEPATGFEQVLRDIFDLVELQMQLLSVDSQEARRKLSKAILLASFAVPLSSAMFTVALFGTGYVFHETLEWSLGTSMLAASGVTAFVVFILGLVAYNLIRTAAATMQETKSEFAESLRWIKATIISPKTSARNQLRHESFSQTSSNGETVDNLGTKWPR